MIYAEFNQIGSGKMGDSFRPDIPVQKTGCIYRVIDGPIGGVYRVAFTMDDADTTGAVKTYATKEQADAAWKK